MVPVDPANLVILAISVVISLLCPSKLIATAEHWGALRDKERDQQIAALLPAQRVDFRIIGRSFGAAVPGLIVVVAIIVIFAVGFVMLFAVANEIGQSEAVMRRDEIHAGIRTAAVVLIKIRTAR